MRFILEFAQVLRQLRRKPPNLWLTYHSYYKAPDVLGALCTFIHPMPYFIFQGVYATKRRRHWKTGIGFLLNRWALCRAAAVFTNKRIDEINLRRLLPASRVHYIAPGIDTAAFQPDPVARRHLRRKWRCGREPVILAAAMFRPGVKTEGLTHIISACEALRHEGRRFYLVICGEGATGPYLRELAQRSLGGRAIFTGQVARHAMNRVYSAADVFAFPGIREGLGMVYLEAQACELPVVAYDRWGAAEVVVNGKTGWLCSPDEPGALAQALDRLIADRDLRRRMGAAARTHVTTRHDQHLNYRRLERKLKQSLAQNDPGGL